jgi:hypothetical protein
MLKLFVGHAEADDEDEEELLLLITYIEEYAMFTSVCAWNRRLLLLQL